MRTTYVTRLNRPATPFPYFHRMRKAVERHLKADYSKIVYSDKFELHVEMNMDMANGQRDSSKKLSGTDVPESVPESPRLTHVDDSAISMTSIEDDSVADDNDGESSDDEEPQKKKMKLRSSGLLPSDDDFGMPSPIRHAPSDFGKASTDRFSHDENNTGSESSSSNDAQETKTSEVLEMKRLQLEHEQIMFDKRAKLLKCRANFVLMCMERGANEDEIERLVKIAFPLRDPSE